MHRSFILPHQLTISRHLAYLNLHKKKKLREYLNRLTPPWTHLPSQIRPGLCPFVITLIFTVSLTLQKQIGAVLPTPPPAQSHFRRFRSTFLFSLHTLSFKIYKQTNRYPTPLPQLIVRSTATTHVPSNSDTSSTILI